MLEKPALADQVILSALEKEYDLLVNQLTFLPLGYDVNTAVYRLDAAGGATYFLKLRKGLFEEISVTLPHYLKELGLQAVISPLETRSGQLWGNLEDYTTILYPFIEGKNGYEIPLSDSQWLEFGAALYTLHTAQLPPALRKRIPQETYSSHWRDILKRFQSQIAMDSFDEPVAAKLADFMRHRRGTISQVISRATLLADELQNRSMEYVLCHSDVHPGNLHLTPLGELYIVDWDNPIYAPKERDLSLIGGGASSLWRSPHEETLFYQGYAPDYSGPNYPPPGINRIALAYYRFERIVVDMAEFCNQLFLTHSGGEDREQSYIYFTSLFLPDHEIDLAFKNEL